MALSVTAAGVLSRSGATIVSGTAGASITAGQAVYLDNNDSEWKLAQADGTAAEAGSSNVGVSLHASEDGQPLDVITAGDWYAGAAATEGEDYYVSDTPGTLDDRGEHDINTGAYSTLVCRGLASGDLRMVSSYTGAQIQ